MSIKSIKNGNTEHTNGAVDGSVENTSGVRGRGVPEVLHDEWPVAEDVDHVADMDLPDFGHLLTLLVSWGGAV